MTQTQNPSAQKDANNNNNNNNGLISLLINIVIPTLVLKYLSKWWEGDQGPLLALVVALLFPLSYGIFDYVRSRKSNIISILGLVNTLLTGGFALFQLQGFWFVVKEASIPLAIGLVVLFSAFGQRPLIHLMIFNDKVINIQLVQQRLREKGTENSFALLLRSSTIYLSFSFFLSALLNFLLARSIFVDVTHVQDALLKSQVINGQISDMMWKGYIVIALPCLIFISSILWYLIKGIKRYTELDLSDIIRQN